MITVTKDKPIFYAVGNPIIVTGIVDVGGLVVTALPTVTGESESAFLTASNGKATVDKPLPDTGRLEAGDMYGYAGGIVIVRQSHDRTIYTPAETPALFTVYRAGAGTLEWIDGEKVMKGQERTYGGKTYSCLQDHQTQKDWTPDKTVALWKEVIETPATGEWAAGVAYKVGAEVTYKGKTYVCLQAHTSISTWMPSVVPALWKEKK